MADPSHSPSHRVVRITQSDAQNPKRLEGLLQPLYMLAEPVVDLSGFDGEIDGLASHLKHLNRYQTSKGGNRLRIVADSTVRRTLGASVFRFFDTVEEALTST